MRGLAEAFAALMFVTAPNLLAAQSRSTAPATAAVAMDTAGSQVRGVIRGVSEITIAADIVARVLEAPLRDGDRFGKGDMLVRFDCLALEAERDGARASWRGHRNNHESNIRLKKFGAGSEFAIIAARSDMEKADADVRRLEARLRSCKIEAPFDGRVIERVVSPHESPAANQPLVRIVDDTDLDIQLVVPSRWLSWLKPQMEFSFTVDETGKTYPARINLIGAVVDPVSQTVRLRCGFVDRPADVLTGMSGAANLTAPREVAGNR